MPHLQVLVVFAQQIFGRWLTGTFSQLE